MSFGFSVGDFILLAQLTGRAYTSWKNACGEYTEITEQLNGLHTILGRLNKETNAPESLLRPGEADHDSLRRILGNSQTTVTQLNDVIVRFKSLGGSQKSNWDRLRLANSDLGEMRSKLNLHISVITAYLETIGVSALGRIEHDIGELPEMRKVIDKIAFEIRAGRRESSNVSTMTLYEGDDQKFWRELRRELIGDGFSSVSIKKCKRQLKCYIRFLHEEGLLEEDEPIEPVDDDAWSLPLQMVPALVVAATDPRGANELIKGSLNLVDEEKSGARVETEASHNELFGNGRRPVIGSGNGDKLNLEASNIDSGFSASSEESEVVRVPDGRQITATDLWTSQSLATTKPVVTDGEAPAKLDGQSWQTFIGVGPEPTEAANVSPLSIALHLETETLEVSRPLQRASLPTGNTVEVLGKPCSEADLVRNLISKHRLHGSAPSANGKLTSSDSKRPSDKAQDNCELVNSESGIKQDLAHPCMDCLNLHWSHELRHREFHGARTLKGLLPHGWTYVKREGFDLFINNCAVGEEERLFLLPPVPESNPKTSLPPGWTQVESASGRISWTHESGLLSYEHPTYSKYISYGCEKHSMCMSVCGHRLDSKRQPLTYQWEYLHDHDRPVDGRYFRLCRGDLVCEMNPRAWTGKLKGILKPAEDPNGWLEVHDIDGRVLFRNLMTHATSRVDPRWPLSTYSNISMQYKWDYKFPPGWHRYHDCEGKVYFGKRGAESMTATWLDPRWKDSWNKFARQKDRMNHSLVPANPGGTTSACPEVVHAEGHDRVLKPTYVKPTCVIF